MAATTQILIAGHGGQGVMDLGNYIAYRAILQGKHVAYTPSYGPETRGGKARCFVVTSEEEIDSPIPEQPDVLLVMNLPSMDFEPLLKPSGTLLMNTTLINREPGRCDIRTVKVPATELADSLKKEMPTFKDTRLASNSVMFGSFVATEEDAFDKDQVQHIMEHFYGEDKARFIPLNVLAVEKGFHHAKTHSI